MIALVVAGVRVGWRFLAVCRKGKGNEHTCNNFGASAALYTLGCRPFEQPRNELTHGDLSVVGVGGLAFLDTFSVVVVAELAGRGAEMELARWDLAITSGGEGINVVGGCWVVGDRSFGLP